MLHCLPPTLPHYRNPKNLEHSPQCASLLQLLTQHSLQASEEVSVKGLPSSHRLCTCPRRMVLMWGPTQSTVGSAMPRQVILGYVRKLAKKHEPG